MTGPQNGFPYVMSATPCRACPLRRQPLFVPFTPAEVAFMESFKTGELVVQPGTTFLTEGTGSAQLYTVLRGLGVRHKGLPDGRRQVINFLLPGDFAGLQAGLMGEMKHSVEARTPMTLCVFDRSRLWEMFREAPQRAYDLTWIAAVEEHFLGEALATLGQRDAPQRIAWALLKLSRRLLAVGLGRDGAVPLPYRQQDLADALGLSLVHTNKTLGRMREAGLCTWTEGVLHVTDPAGLARLGMVEPEDPEARPLM